MKERDEELWAILHFDPNVAPKFDPTYVDSRRQGNSLQDLRLSLKGFRFAKWVIMGNAECQSAFRNSWFLVAKQPKRKLLWRAEIARTLPKYLKETKLIKHSSLLIVTMVLVACTNQVSTNSDGIVLGVIRTWMNIPDTYVINTNGSGSIHVQLPENLDGALEWSPDGKWIISSSQYEVGRPEDSAIYLIRSDGSQRRLIIHNTGGSFDPTWSLDGTRIAYYARDSQPGIYTENGHKLRF